MWTFLAILGISAAFAIGYVIGQGFGTERLKGDQFLERERAYNEGFEEGKEHAKWEASVKAAKKSKPKKITARKKAAS